MDDFAFFFSSLRDHCDTSLRLTFLFVRADVIEKVDQSMRTIRCTAQSRILAFIFVITCIFYKNS